MRRRDAYRPGRAERIGRRGHGVCRKVGIRTIAEFVETPQTLDALREIGVDYAQGFGMALPEPINNLP